jgi:AraC family transcriptional regulator
MTYRPEGARSSYGLNQTALEDGKELTVLAKSDELGWQSLHASLTVAQPHPYQVTHRPVPDLWLSMALTTLDVSMKIADREERLIVPPDRVSILSPDACLGVRRGSSTRVLHVFLKGSLLAEVSGELLGRDVQDFDLGSTLGIEDRVLSCLLRSLEQSLLEGARHSALQIEFTSRALVSRLLDRSTLAVLRNRSLAAQLRDRLTPRQMQRAMEFIREHLRSEISLKDLAREVGVSRTILAARFKSSFQVTPYQYVLNARIDRGIELLATTLLSISEIASSCGFADPSHFSAAFKRVVGVPPSTYRLQVH